jgi:hypothetical protein
MSDALYLPNHATTPIDGANLWDSWTRNFATPLLAVWDIIDNALDAAHPVTGRLHVSSSSDEDLIIANTCHQPVAPLSVILKAYKSNKSQNNTIGENGVGLKQGCATLSDLTFVLTRNKYQYGVGLLCRALQNDQGLLLPSYEFECRDQNWKQAIFLALRHLVDSHADLQRALGLYGQGETPSERIQKGFRKLVGHMCDLRDGTWGDSAYVFKLVIHDLKHGKACAESKERERLVDTHKRQNLLSFLHQIRTQLPQQYLHVRESFECIVDGKPVFFSYWQRRLADLTHFSVVVNPHFKLNVARVRTILDGIPGDDEYLLNVYVGFDPTRCSEEKAQKEANLHIYSRRAGRLIRSYQDCRGLLKLTSGGTDFCQALTILVDDAVGALPLNPTKQDFAFGEQAHGETHSENIFCILAGIAKTYYMYHLREGSSGRKKTLTERVVSVKDDIIADEDYDDSVEHVKCFSDCDFTTFQNIEWKLVGGRLQALKRNFTVCQGADSVLALPEAMPQEKEAPLAHSVLAQAHGISDERMWAVRTVAVSPPKTQSPPSPKVARGTNNSPPSLRSPLTKKRKVQTNTYDSSSESTVEADDNARLKLELQKKDEQLLLCERKLRERESELDEARKGNERLENEVETYKDLLSKYQEKKRFYQREHKKLARDLEKYQELNPSGFVTL